MDDMKIIRLEFESALAQLKESVEYCRNICLEISALSLSPENLKAEIEKVDERKRRAECQNRSSSRIQP